MPTQQTPTNTTPAPACARRHRPVDDGSVAMAWVVLFLGFTIIVGLLLDAGHLLHANSQAADLAAKAARAGAQALDIDATTSDGRPHLDPTQAAANARALLDRHPDATGEVVVTDTAITVTVHLHVTFTLLAPFSDGRTVTWTRTANPQPGQ